MLNPAKPSLSEAPKGSRAPRILFAVTSAHSCGFYRGSLAHLKANGFEPILVSSPGSQLEATGREEGVRTIAVPMEREISAGKDLAALLRLVWVMVRWRPALVEVSTPKMGLVGGLAAWLTRVPHRVYLLRGLRLETTRGVKRSILTVAERTACACAHHVACVSPSLRARVLELNLAAPAKLTLWGQGTSHGIDVERFRPRRECLVPAAALRAQLGLPPDGLVIGFVARLTRDKGLPELMESYRRLRTRFPQLSLLLLGEFEEPDPIEARLRREIESDPSVIRTGFVPDTAPYYPIMDVLALPTYREGFPAVPLEAQACEVPVVTTTATGAVDSVVDGETGYLVPVGDSEALARALSAVLEDPSRRDRMGRAGRQWIERRFNRQMVWDWMVANYRRLCAVESNGRRSAETHKEGRPAPGSGWGAIKRGIDVLGAAAGLVALSPVLALVAVLIRITMGKPVLFRQDRPGFLTKPFALLKFRTMQEAYDSGGRPLPDAARLTPLGRWLRQRSLDELPQLWNVLRGDMSLVGPRPLLTRYLHYYTPEERQRFRVRPGITGLAQVSGRNVLSWDERMALDRSYVRDWSPWLDLEILGRTLARVLWQEGVQVDPSAMMQDFDVERRSRLHV